MSRETVLKFIKAHHGKTGKVPSIRTIAVNVDGVTKSNFYNFFSGGINEALGLVGIKEFVEKPEKAMEARKDKAGGGFCVSLNETQSQRLAAIAYMDGQGISLTLDEIFNREREVREILAQIDVKNLDAETIDAMLNPNYIHDGINVSTISGEPWFTLDCPYCNDPIFVSKRQNPGFWNIEIQPILENVFKGAHDNCRPKRQPIIKIQIR